MKNKSAEKLRVQWVNYACVEIAYGTASSGNAKTQPTYVGHRWRIRSDVDATIRGDFVLDGPGAYDVIVR